VSAQRKVSEPAPEKSYWIILRAHEAIRNGPPSYNGGGHTWVDGYYVLKSWAMSALRYWDRVDSGFRHVLVEVKWPQPSEDAR
jgi:hypothetical protein